MSVGEIFPNQNRHDQISPGQDTATRIKTPTWMRMPWNFGPGN